MGKNIAAFLIAVVLLCVPLSACGATDAALSSTAHQAQQGGAPVYSYVMTYGAPGAVQGAEIPLVFRTSAPENAEMSDIMSAIWAQFARTGNPGVDGLPQWEPYTPEGGAAMILDTESHLAYHHDAALLELLKPGYIY